MIPCGDLILIEKHTGLKCKLIFSKGRKIFRKGGSFLRFQEMTC